ncbi:MAG: hypothetical protein KAU28_06450, partial [Phycisphaerae bacterium]|nr:hypothetical protein [Phycisphaerae bacterium]
ELDLKFVVAAEVTDASRRGIRGGGEVKVTRAPFFVYLKPAQNVYGPGDSVEINIKTEDPNGKPVTGRFGVEAWRVERIRKVEKVDGEEKIEFEEKLAQKVHAEEIQIPDTGRASVRFTPDVTGRLKVIVNHVTKLEKNIVQGSCELWVASKTGAEAHYAYGDLQLIPAADQYEIGETMKVLINTNKTDSYVLLTGEADALLFTRVVHVEKNSKLVELPVGKELCPNFTLTATLIRDNRLYMDTKQIVVPPTHRFIKVDVALAEGSMGGGADNTYQPREKTKIRVKLTDVRTGRPLVGEVALMLVDSSVYYIQPEFRDAIEKAFYGFTRRVRVRTTNSYAGPASFGERPYRGYRQARYRNRTSGRVLWGAEESAAPRVMSMAKGAEREAEAAEPLAETIVREFFKDTVLWAGLVVTDADGTAEVPVEMPDQLTTFALHAIAVDAETRVGQTQTDVITTKHIICRLESGRFFTEGDHSYVTVIAHNYFDGP